MRRFAAVLVLVLLTAVSATAQEPPPPPPLSAERYAAIEPVFTAAVPLDKDTPSAAAVKTFRDRCATLADGDALLVAVRGDCRSLAKVQQLFSDADRCRTPGSCLKALKRIPPAMDRHISALRGLNRAALEVTDAECRTALRTSKSDLTKLDRIRDLIHALNRALESGSERRIERAGKRLEAADVTTRTYKRRLRQLQEGCR